MDVNLTYYLSYTMFLIVLVSVYAIVSHIMFKRRWGRRGLFGNKKPKRENLYNTVLPQHVSKLKEDYFVVKTDDKTCRYCGKSLKGRL